MLALLMGTIRARRWIDANTLGSLREPPAAKPQSCHLGKRLPSRPLGIDYLEAKYTRLRLQ
jgi:hypothetical protein